jgi:hypothetical protein
MSRGDRRPGPGQRGIPVLEHDRLWTRQPPRTADPLNAADACPKCQGTGVDLGASEPDGVCSLCFGTGWAP